MSNQDKLFVIGTDIDTIHRWTTANGIPWSRVEPVTGSDALRTRPGQRWLTYTWADVSKMHSAVLSVIRTQLSIRRCLGSVTNLTGLYGAPTQNYWEMYSPSRKATP